MTNKRKITPAVYTLGVTRTPDMSADSQLPRMIASFQETKEWLRAWHEALQQAELTPESERTPEQVELLRQAVVESELCPECGRAYDDE